MKLILQVGVRHPVTGDMRNGQRLFDPLTLDATKMAALRTQILAWADELETAALTMSPSDL